MVGTDPVITPDGTDPASSPAPRRRPAVLVGIASLVVFAGLMILGTLTAPDPAAVEEATTTTAEEVEPPIDPENFTVGQIATGDPLDWDLSMAIDDGYPLELLEHEKDLYLFTSSEHLDGPDSPGLMAWRSSNGTNWEPLGEVISTDHRITTVDSTVQGLVATSIRLDDGALVLWESGDASEWTGSEIPTGTEGPYHLDVASAVGANETTLVVASNARYDRERLLEDRLMMTLGIELDLSDLAWDLRWLGEDGHHLLIDGPFSIPVLETPIDALGVNSEERQELTNELFDPVGTDVWVRNRSDEWESGFIGDTRIIDSIITTPDDLLITYGTGTSGRLARKSGDGIEWAPAVSTVSPWQVQSWKQRYVGAVNTPDLMVSDDGETWKSAGLAERFPDELPWAPITLGAGEGGVAMFVRGDGRRPPMQPGSLELTAPDGSPFLLVHQGGEFVMISDDGRSRWVLNAGSRSELDDSIEIDVARKRLTLLHPETGQDWVSFTFEELEQANREYSRDLMQSIQPWNVMAFTENGEEWVIQDMAPEIGDHTAIWLLEITGDRIVAVLRNTLDTLIRDEAPGLEIWSAPIP